MAAGPVRHDNEDTRLLSNSSALLACLLRTHTKTKKKKWRKKAALPGRRSRPSSPFSSDRFAPSKSAPGRQLKEKKGPLAHWFAKVQNSEACAYRKWQDVHCHSPELFLFFFFFIFRFASLLLGWRDYFVFVLVPNFASSATGCSWKQDKKKRGKREYDKKIACTHTHTHTETP